MHKNDLILIYIWQEFLYPQLLTMIDHIVDIISKERNYYLLVWNIKNTLIYKDLSLNYNKTIMSAF